MDYGKKINLYKEDGYYLMVHIMKVNLKIINQINKVYGILKMEIKLKEHTNRLLYLMKIQMTRN